MILFFEITYLLTYFLRTAAGIRSVFWEISALDPAEKALNKVLVIFLLFSYKLEFSKYFGSSILSLRCPPLVYGLLYGIETNGSTFWFLSFDDGLPKI